ncbi:MAG: T9SS type A sorting domain-containing protein, partial [Bacteroidota bacterium]
MNYMRKINLLLGLLLVFAFSADAQRIADKWSFDKRDIGYQLMDSQESTHPVQSNILPKRGNSIWFEGFDGASGAGTISATSGDWTAGGVDGAVWKFSTTPTNGCWSGGTGMPGTASAADGFLLFDADSVNCQDPTTNPPTFTQVDLIGSIESPVINLENNPAVGFRFDHSYRWCCTDMIISVAISTDGGGSYGPENFIDVIDANVQMDETFVWNISAIAGGESNVKIRWTWEAPSHYYWVIDDVELYVPEDNDLSVTDAGYSNWNGATATDYIDLEYSIYPAQQLRPIDFVSRVVNNGGTQQTGVTLNATINYDGGTIDLSSPSIALNPGEDSLLMIEDWTPPGDLGEYLVTLEVVQDQPDIDPTDQINEVSFWLENDIMARDRRTAGAVYNNTGALGHTLGNAFGMSEDATVYAIGVAMSSTSDEESEWTVELWGDGATDFEFLVGGDEDQAYGDAQGNGTGDEFISYIYLDDPYEVEEGLDYYGHFKAYGGDGNEAFIRTSGNSIAQTSFVFIEEDATWFFTTATPMVRLGFANPVSLSDVEINDKVKLGQNVPNPAQEISTIAYELVNAQNVQFEIYDLTGKIVMTMNEGAKPAGVHNIVLNTEDLNSGIYYYSIIIEGERLTRKMVVAK